MDALLILHEPFYLFSLERQLKCFDRIYMNGFTFSIISTTFIFSIRTSVAYIASDNRWFSLRELSIRSSIQYN